MSDKDIYFLLDLIPAIAILYALHVLVKDLSKNRPNKFKNNIKSFNKESKKDNTDDKKSKSKDKS